jgi:hypothetical protein
MLMKTRNLILTLIVIVILITLAGIWGILGLRTDPSAVSSLTIKSSPTVSSSLYKTGALVIPTVKVTNSTANCDQKDLQNLVTSDPARGTGSKGIKPHLCSVPTFTEQDVRQYMSTIHSFTGFRIAQTSAKYALTRILFVTNQVANQEPGLNADTGVSDPGLIVCYVEVYGDFSVAGPPIIRPAKATPVAPPVLHHGVMVFDGLTGNVLDTGVGL